MSNGNYDPVADFIKIGKGSLDWRWLAEAERVKRTQYLVHSRLERALIIKVDGRQARAVVLPKK